MAIAVANPTIRVNQETIAIVPNSVSFVLGRGEKTVRAASAGGGSIVPVHTDDAESKIGAVTFSVYPTVDNLRSIPQWQNNIGENTVDLIGNAGGESIQYSFALSSVTNDPEHNPTADGTIEIEFMGAPAAIA